MNELRLNFKFYAVKKKPSSNITHSDLIKKMLNLW